MMSVKIFGQYLFPVQLAIRQTLTGTNPTTNPMNSIAKAFLSNNVTTPSIENPSQSPSGTLNIIPENRIEYDRLYSKLEIEIKGVDPAVLKSYGRFSTTAAGHLGIDVGKYWEMRKSQKNRFVLLKSVHIYKKHRVQYEIRTYYRFMHFHKLTESTLNTFLEYIERNLPEGVAIKATKIEIQSVPVHLKLPPSQQ